MVGGDGCAVLACGGDGCRKGKPSDVTVHSPCGRTPFAVPMVNPLTASSPCGRAHLVTDSPNPVDGNTFPLRADAPVVHPAIQSLAHGYIPHVGGRPPRTGRGLPTRKAPSPCGRTLREDAPPSRSGWFARAGARQRPECRAGQAVRNLPDSGGSKECWRYRVTWLGKPKRSCRRASRLQ